MRICESCSCKGDYVCPDLGVLCLHVLVPLSLSPTAKKLDLMPNRSQTGSTIRNFRAVQEGLLRGGQPSPEGFKELSDLGVRTVLSLRTGKRSAEREAKIVEELGMKFIHIPVYYLSLPDEETIERVLKLLEDAQNQPVYMHCFHGVDRTGFFVALYRMSRLGWSFQEAYEEMKKCGFHRLRCAHFKWVLRGHARRMGTNEDRGNNRADFSVKRS